MAQQLRASKALNKHLSGSCHLSCPAARIRSVLHRFKATQTETA